MAQSEIDRATAKVQELKIKLKNAVGDGDIYYYRTCLRGWEKMLDKLKATQR